MSKTLGRKENFRVVVEPKGMGNFGFASMGVGLLYNLRDPKEVKRLERDEEDRCNDIASEIKRHVDYVSSVSVEFDQDSVCEHCGSKWTEESTTYNGGCCAADEDAEEARRSSEVQP